MITREIKYMENELDSMLAYLKPLQCCANSINSILEYIDIDEKKETYNINQQNIIKKLNNITELINSFVDSESEEIDIIKKMIYELISVNNR